MTTASDNFDRANGALGANWTTRLGPGHSISSNQVVGSFADDTRSTFSGATWGATYQRVGCKVSNLLANAQYAGPTAFMSGSGATLNGVEFASDGSSGTGHTAVWEWVSGSQSEILAIATTVAAGDLLEIEVDLAASTLKCYKNGVQVGTTLTYTNNPSGEPGICTYGAANIDDWTATDGVSGPKSLVVDPAARMMPLLVR